MDSLNPLKLKTCNTCLPIEEIIDCCSSSFSIGFSDSKNIYDSIEELIQYKGNSVDAINITGNPQDPSDYFSIKIKKEKVTISCAGSKQICDLGYKLESLFRKKIQWHYVISNPYIWWFIMWVPLPAAVIFQTIGYVGVSCLLFVIWVATLANRHLNFNINLSRRHEAGFIKRTQQPPSKKVG
jgi:hypothetical protein